MAAPTVDAQSIAFCRLTLLISAELPGVTPKLFTLTRFLGVSNVCNKQEADYKSFFEHGCRIFDTLNPNGVGNNENHYCYRSQCFNRILNNPGPVKRQLILT